MHAINHQQEIFLAIQTSHRNMTRKHDVLRRFASAGDAEKMKKRASVSQRYGRTNAGTQRDGADASLETHLLGFEYF